MNSLYLIGSLRNEELVHIGNTLREALPGIEIFDDWWAPGRRADDHWKEYEQARGRTYKQALGGWAAKHVFEFDKYHLDRCDGAVLCLPSGRSCHLEFGYMAGQGKRTYVLMDSPDRWDVMYQFATGIAFSMEELIEQLREVGQEDVISGSSCEHMEQGPQHKMRSSDNGRFESSGVIRVQWVSEGDGRQLRPGELTFYETK